jgi:hypothetical protein
MTLLHYNRLKAVSECYICNQGLKTHNNKAFQNYTEKSNNSTNHKQERLCAYKTMTWNIAVCQTISLNVDMLQKAEKSTESHKLLYISLNKGCILEFNCFQKTYILIYKWTEVSYLHTHNMQLFKIYSFLKLGCVWYMKHIQ